MQTEATADIEDRGAFAEPEAGLDDIDLPRDLRRRRRKHRHQIVVGEEALPPLAHLFALLAIFIDFGGTRRRRRTLRSGLGARRSWRHSLGSVRARQWRIIALR